jgi:hypothetical protein
VDKFIFTYKKDVPIGRGRVVEMEKTIDRKECEIEHEKFCFACLFDPDLNSGMAMDDYRVFKAKCVQLVKKFSPQKVCFALQQYHRANFKKIPSSTFLLRADLYQTEWSIESIFHHVYSIPTDDDMYQALMTRVSYMAGIQLISSGLFESSVSGVERLNPSLYKQFEKIQHKLNASSASKGRR